MIERYACAPVAWMAVLISASAAMAARPDLGVPDDFPRFVVPGHEKAMNSLRELYWLHYRPAGPLATLWDEWMPNATLWPAVRTNDAMDLMRARWRQSFIARIMDPEGYIATHQHASIAHQLGWPFPYWALSPEGWGWHFSLQNVPAGWHGTTERTQEGWTITGGEDAGIADAAWNVRLTAPHAAVQPPPPIRIGVLQAPFIQLRWRATGLGNAQPFIEWTTESSPGFSPERRMYFAPIESAGVVYTMVPVFRHPKWQGPVTGLRVNFGNEKAGGTVGIQALFTQYDTRHPINNSNFVRGCVKYFRWTRDIHFLRDQIQRMRLAMRYMMTEFKAVEEKCIVVPFVGHCGRSGLEIKADKTKTIRPGMGIGNHYWDILPGGHRDAIATLYYYDALNYMAAMEREIAAHPEWDIPGGPLRLDPTWLDRHAAEVKEHSGRLFWNPETKRFGLGIDVDGKSYDYGYTFMNLEAICFGLASPEQERDIMTWIAGDRVVAGDTSQGADIYHWRFGPRATTRRNVEWYGWYWSAPETVPWGGQVQDGGAVLGFSYHDMMARLKTRGADDAWSRLREVVRWFDEVQDAGGYREYYKGGERGSLQGGGTPGGLGLDAEFFESILVPQVVFEGFLGFQPTATGFRLMPRLPKAWPELAVDRIHLHGLVLTIRVAPSRITVSAEGDAVEPFRAEFPPGPWRVRHIGRTGREAREDEVPVGVAPASVCIDWAATSAVELAR